MKRTACLIGNGLSIALEPSLSIPQLTSQLLRAFAEGEDSLAMLAARVSGDQADFEHLIGPFDSAAQALAALPGFGALLQSNGQSDELTRVVSQARELLSAVYRSGVGTALDLVAQLARATSSIRLDDVVVRFCEELAALDDDGDLAVATLNYDGLLHAGFLTEVPDDPNDTWNINTHPLARIADLANGRWGAEVQHVVLDGASAIEGRPLRTADDFPAGRIAVLQLHGSAAWLREPNGSGRIWKFELDALRDVDYWNRWRGGETEWSPVVVLTDQKTSAVNRWPFDFAYDIFTTRLVTADRWLIAGYGLGDEPVNLAFKQALNLRRSAQLGEPSVLVVDIGGDVDEHRSRMVNALGLPSDNIIVSLDGLPGVLDTATWLDWKAI